MTLKEAIKSSLTILKQVMEEKLNATNIEVNFKPTPQPQIETARRCWMTLPITGLWSCSRSDILLSGHSVCLTCDEFFCKSQRVCNAL